MAGNEILCKDKRKIWTNALMSYLRAQIFEPKHDCIKYLHCLSTYATYCYALKPGKNLEEEEVSLLFHFDCLALVFAQRTSGREKEKKAHFLIAKTGFSCIRRKRLEIIFLRASPCLEWRKNVLVDPSLLNWRWFVFSWCFHRENVFTMVQYGSCTIEPTDKNKNNSYFLFHEATRLFLDQFLAY